MSTSSACHFGWVEYDSYRYCHEHGGFAAFYGSTPNRCARAGEPLTGGEGRG